LGLLIIDEEQKFGVSVKEKLKQLKVNVDTLTLTATPIPRTLQFSLMGARDLSIINTPPPNRFPVQTELHVFDEEIIREAIELEMSRNGQVFFVNNRIQSIYQVASMVKRVVPNARVAVGHGQMPSDVLEEIIVDFINYEYDVLVATTIIESGIDIPNVNTIIINSAHRFGLSDLHQLRGRVGRSNRKAYCYLLAPELSLLTPDARRRLQAIETFSDLGSGFNIAMQDLDIRGAGNMLGSEQSGFIQIDTDIELLFPDDYIENVSERISLYRELDGIENDEALVEFMVRLRDRFGEIPEKSQSLIEVVRLRWLAIRFGVEKLVLKNEKMTAFLVSNPQSVYYQSDYFGRMLRYITNNPRRCQLREQKGKRSVVISPIKTVEEAKRVFEAF
jgi:transcription-repair coupling factor (superfamily II helicase)